jgi:hypothetical protein
MPTILKVFSWHFKAHFFSKRSSETIEDKTSSITSKYFKKNVGLIRDAPDIRPDNSALF